MTLRGSAFLALWNDVEPDRDAEYQDWHAVEHVPERVGIAGFLAGRRYRAAGGPGHAQAYFTLYELATLDALLGPAYAEVVQHPTGWSRGLRPSLRSVVRRACRTLASAGVGSAAALGVFRIESRGGLAGADPRLHAVARAVVGPLAGTRGIVSAHLGLADEAAVASHPFQDATFQDAWGQASTDAAPGHRRLVLLIEGSLDAVRDALPSARDAVLAGFGEDVGLPPPGCYEIDTWVERSHLPSPAPARQPPRPDRQRGWLRHPPRCGDEESKP